MAKPPLIILHASGTPNGRWITIDDIDQWHQTRGKRRIAHWASAHQPHLASIGYHYVITTDGAVAEGRHHREPSDSAKGYNSNSLSICLIGTNKFTAAQWDSLATLVADLRVHHCTDVIGHRSLDANKACPGFDVSRWLADGMRPRPDHLLES